jgi:hypothetical protein
MAISSRPTGVDQGPDPRIRQDLGGRTDVPGDDVDGAGVGEQRPAVCADDRIVVHVDDVNRRVGLVRDLAHVALRGQPGSDVQELRDARLAHQVAHHPAQERPVRPRRERRLGGHLHGPGHELPVSGEIVLPAREVGAVTHWSHEPARKPGDPTPPGLGSAP